MCHQHPPLPGYACTARDICQCHTPLSLGRMRSDTQGDSFPRQWNAYSPAKSKGGWEHLRCCFNIHINLVLVFQKEYKLHTLQYGLYTWKYLFKIIQRACCNSVKTQGISPPEQQYQEVRLCVTFCAKPPFLPLVCWGFVLMIWGQHETIC